MGVEVKLYTILGQMGQSRKMAWDKNGTNIKHFVPCVRGATSINISTKIADVFIFKSGTDLKHFVPR